MTDVELEGPPGSRMNHINSTGEIAEESEKQSLRGLPGILEGKYN